MSEKEFESEEEEEEEAPPAKPTPSPTPATPSPAPPTESPAPPAEAPAEEAPPEPKKLKPKPRPEPRDEEEGGGMSEAQLAMLAAQKKHEEEDARRDKEYQERRENEKLSLEEDLSRLKEKLAERKAIRAEEEARLQELKHEDEEKHRLEREEKKKELEDKKRAKELELKKSSASCVVPLPRQPVGRNYQPKGGKGKAAEEQKERAAEEGPSDEELAEMKRQYLQEACKAIEFSGMDVHVLKDKVKQLHARLVRLETGKYDLTKRAEGQAYELLELKEREKQRARLKAKESGLEEEDAAASRPPKIRVASKFDRTTDKRSFGERYIVYEKPIIPKAPKLYHGTPRPPPEFGHPAATNEELETLRKSMDPAKGRYNEVAPIEGAKPPVEPIAPKVPDDNAPDEPEPAPAAAQPAAAQPAGAPAAKQRDAKEPVNPFKAIAKK